MMAGATEAVATQRYDLRAADGAKLALYRMAGPTNAPVLIWGHANSFCARSYRELFNRLAPYYSLWSWDSRGQGASLLPEGGPSCLSITLDTLAADAAVICEHVRAVEGRIPHVAAHSFSGVALLWAAQRGLIWQSATLFEPPLVAPERAADPIAKERNRRSVEIALARRRIWDSPEAFFARLRALPAYAGIPDASLAAHVEASLERNLDGNWQLCCAPETEAAVYSAVFDPAAFLSLSKLALPVQFVASDATLQTSPVQGIQAVASAIVGRPSIDVEGASHFLPMEKPDECAALIGHMISAFER